MHWNTYNRPFRRIPVRVLEDEDTRPPSGGQPIEMDEEDHRPASVIGDEVAPPATDQTDWQSLALRLQADMDNFRKRQIRRADEAVATERERLLRLMLSVVDNLARALSHEGQGDGALRHGIELTYRELMRLLESEGVTRIEAVGQPFTPELHEAVTTVEADAENGTVVEELETGYKLGERLLRPARVVVAT